MTLNIIHICSEFAPIIKVGGLADVTFGLCKELSDLGHNVKVFLPHYKSIKLPSSSKKQSIPFTMGSKTYTLDVHITLINNIEVHLIECSHPHPFFHRDSPYSCDAQTEIDSFLFFNRAVCEVLLHYREKAILHLHDWPSSLIPLIMKFQLHELTNLIQGTLLTIHNLEFQGKCTREDLAKIDIIPTQKMLFADIEKPKKFNMLKSGIEFADAITTVSKTYAQEIQTSEQGWWLEKTLQKHRKKLFGIINGLDEKYWNPLKDSFLKTPFSHHDHYEEILSAKHGNKRALQKELNLPQIHQPLIVAITRLTTQKGPHLILHAMQKSQEMGFQFVLLGSVASVEMQNDFKALKTNPNIYIEHGYNEGLAHRCFGGADAILIPSLFEPCGLTQLIGMRYGTVPIVRRTGGLNDTVTHRINGFEFNDADTHAIDWVLNEALECYSNHPSEWERIVKNGLRVNSSWEEPTKEYMALYQKFKG